MAYLASTEAQKLSDRQAECLNQMIVTDAESEDPDQYLQCGTSSEHAHEVIAKPICRRA